MDTKHWLGIGLIALAAGMVVAAHPGGRGPKMAIILHAGKTEGARAWHALLYAKELHQAGHPVRLIFDGAGTAWMAEWEKPEAMHHDTYLAVKKAGLIYAVCDFCATAYQVHGDLEKADAPFQNKYEGHPSVVELVQHGYALLVI